jgi:hypothetical protein
MKDRRNQWVRALLVGALAIILPGALHARDPGVNQPGAVGNPRADPGLNQPGAAGNVGVGAPGVGVRDPGLNQPGAVGNVGVGAPGIGVADPGLNQPGVAGNVGGVARRTVRRYALLRVSRPRPRNPLIPHNNLRRRL